MYAQYKWNGDTVGPLKRWKGVTRYIDNVYSRTTGANKSIKDVFTGPGDWVPPPKSPDNSAFEPQPKVDGKYSAGFSFVHDVGHVAEMARGLGLAKMPRNTVRCLRSSKLNSMLHGGIPKNNNMLTAGRQPILLR